MHRVVAVVAVAGTKQHAENVCFKYKQMQDAGKRSGVTVKALKRTLKKAGLKVSGKKATLRARVKKAHLKVGGGPIMDALKAKASEVADKVIDKADKMADKMVAKADQMAPPPPATGARRRRY